MKPLPAGLLGLRPAFDSLGQTYAAFAGTDPDEKHRETLRNFLAHHLCGQEPRFDGMEGDFARQLYREKDWMTAEKPFGAQE